MRVATAFTGVTACVTGFATAANAQPAGQLAYRAAAGIRGGSCLNVSQWFHVGTQIPGNRGESFCYGGAGNIHVGTVDAFCGGDNYGYFSGVSWYGRAFRHQIFHQSSNYYSFIRAGKFRYEPFTISNLHISNWSGAWTCPTYQ
jgi:hypothetical protein